MKFPNIFSLAFLSLATFAGANESEFSDLALEFGDTEITFPFPEATKAEKTVAASSKVETPKAPFHAFTGQVVGNKVRLRSEPSLEAAVVGELKKGELFKIVGENNDFYSVEAPSGTKAYVFRSFVLDGVVEGNRVNVRLKPDLDAPIIAHLNAGDHVSAVPCSSSPKWLEIDAPTTTRYYVAKEFVKNIGGLEVKEQFDKRKSALEELYSETETLSINELQKEFSKINIEKINLALKTIINEYKDFPEYVEKATQQLLAVQEAYLEKKEFFVSEQNRYNQAANSRSFATLTTNQSYSSAPVEFAIGDALNDKMKYWLASEESAYIEWCKSHPNDHKTMEEYYAHEASTAVQLTGLLEAYSAPVKQKPGDYILRENGVPLGYLYSTKVNLDKLVGYRVKVTAIPRENHNFAFPAYFVVDVE